jgi:hypothetical protein
MMNNKEKFIKQVESKKSRKKEKAHHTYMTSIHMVVKKFSDFAISIKGNNQGGKSGS